MRQELDDYLGIRFFVHPVPLAAVAILILNDHFLKAAYPSWLTGKLSDFAGLFFFPLFVCGLVCVFVNLVWNRRKFFELNHSLLIGAVIFTNVLFIAVKMIPEANQLYAHSLTNIGFPSALEMDPTDLIALPATIAAYFWGRRFINPPVPCTQACLHRSN